VPKFVQNPGLLIGWGKRYDFAGIHIYYSRFLEQAGRGTRLGKEGDF
jgi:hypothetical protein